jgi:protein-disulfide isomerase
MNNFNQSARLPSGLKKSWLIAVVVIGVLMIISLASTNFINKKIADIAQQSAASKQRAAAALIYTPDKQAKIEGQNNVWNVFGAAQPKITIVEFGDFTCPYCHEDFPIVRAMMVEHQDIVKFIWRDRTPTERSLVLALTAQCAGEQGKFWAMHDKLFQLQSDILGNAASDLVALGQSINLNMDSFTLCLKNQKYLDKIKQDNAASYNDLGVNGTPTFFINGQKYEGELSASDFEAIINELK